MVGLHALCCGVPALVMLAAALSGAASGAALLAGPLGGFHALLHEYEAVILALSAGLVVSGGVLESLARRSGHARGFPWMFAVSVAAFVANVLIIMAHRAF